MRCFHKIILFAVFIVLSLISSSTTSMANNDCQFYRNQQKHFSICFPKGWSVKKGRNPHVVVKSRSPDHIASILVTITDNAGDGPITKSSSPKDLIKKYQNLRVLLTEKILVRKMPNFS